MQKSKKRKHLAGRTYSLDQIQDIASNLHLASQHSSQIGLMIVYKEDDSNHYWLNGPLLGEGTNTFLYLGLLSDKQQLSTAMAELLPSVLISSAHIEHFGLETLVGDILTCGLLDGLLDGLWE